MKRFWVLCSFSVGLLLALPSWFASAQAWLLSAPTGPTSGLAVLHLIQNLTNWLFVGFMLLAVVVIILAGWQFITGGGNPESVSSARKKLLWAGVAVIIALMSRGIPVVVASILGVGGGGGGGLPPLPPSVALTASSPTVVDGNPVTLTWNTSSVTSCNASGDWAGVKSATGGTEIIPSVTGPGSTKTYTLDCTGPGGTASRSVDVLVAAVTVPPAIAHWDFNDLNTLDTIVDKAGANDGTYDLGAEGWHGGTLNGTTQVPGSPGNGLARNFNGTSDYISLGNNELGNFPDAFTLTAWVKLNSNVLTQAILSEYEFMVCGDAIFGIANGGVYFHDGSASVPQDIQGSTVLSINTWHHVALVSDVSDIRVYLDGNLDGSLGSDLNWRNGCNNTDVIIGKIANDDFYLDGDMDELRVYKGAAFTQAQIAADMNSRYPIVPGQNVASWSFETGAGGQTPDTHHLLQGKYGGAGKFTFDDYVTMGNVLNMGTGDFSIGFWVQGLSRGNIVGKWRDTGLAGYTVRYDPLGGTQVLISNGLDNSARGITLGNGNTTPADGNWHHIAVVVRGSTDIRLYIDGVLDNTDGGSLATEPGNINNSQDFSIGRKNLDSNPMPTHDYMSGILDDLKIWNQTLTAGEVAAEFVAGP